MNNNKFKLQFSENWMKKGDVLTTYDGKDIIVIRKDIPFYKLFLRIITFGIYKIKLQPPYTYIVKIKE